MSSLGHSVILPKLLGWDDVVVAQSATESYFLAFLVGLHVATALALIIFYRHTWLEIVRGVLRSLRTRRIETSTQRLGWLLIVATIPAGIVDILFEHALRVLFATPIAAAAFLFINGLVLAGAEMYRRRAEVRRLAVEHGLNVEGGRRLDSLEFREASMVGVAQVFALLPGISRSGITMAAGLVRGLDHEDAARFSFLLATPIILGEGLYKLPDLLGPNDSGVFGQVLAGSVAAGITAYLSVRFLTRWFTTRRTDSSRVTAPRRRRTQRRSVRTLLRAGRPSVESAQEPQGGYVIEVHCGHDIYARSLSSPPIGAAWSLAARDRDHQVHGRDDRDVRANAGLAGPAQVDADPGFPCAGPPASRMRWPEVVPPATPGSATEPCSPSAPCSPSEPCFPSGPCSPSEPCFPSEPCSRWAPASSHGPG